ncbi:hypothetical protein M3598_19465 [Cytobacillus oceanisediminis]|uniref:hypothetical protein n=1 Tax=Cytobacillus oceanisediminis TaxID=665099 RepID=UPI00203F3A10|nr:hypothetical protein [Cytobacillus oceanisediminis]MCM3244934.1 hypothetical protein [Cytobacillus oceanisediminis]
MTFAAILTFPAVSFAVTSTIAPGKFHEAKTAIRRATIDMEESAKKDYAIRINDYLYHLRAGFKSTNSHRFFQRR